MGLLAPFADIAAAGASLLIAQIHVQNHLENIPTGWYLSFLNRISPEIVELFRRRDGKAAQVIAINGCGVVSASSRSMPPIVDDEIGRNAFSRMMKH
ncbi:hypothetical protein RPD_3327 [Rhodopseudomonas palustris BisB5]|uniref:Uncharacterized protein n=1 Tax=Rhodopseudomonas palustris (strain BisB5) TaxID=316057 RepID=Q134D8_RHOPS|nr:hypothetical protein RPD_3327 [Rhodopseudomonas palustris BisB5]